MIPTRWQMCMWLSLHAHAQLKELSSLPLEQISRLRFLSLKTERFEICYAYAGNKISLLTQALSYKNRH